MRFSCQRNPAWKATSMHRMLPQEKLIVYEKALSFLRLITPLLTRWPTKYAVCNQFDRACESLIINLARAAGNQTPEQRVYALECSLGSALECAACLDIAYTRQLLDIATMHELKETLRTIVRMEVGLRKSWNSSVHEEAETYSIDTKIFFSHESLKVYQGALRICGLIETHLLAQTDQWHKYSRRADEAITSLVLNLAEGNGRFSRLDHAKFMAIAEDAGIRLATYLDLFAAVFSGDVTEIKTELRKVIAMVIGMRSYLHNK